MGKSTLELGSRFLVTLIGNMTFVGRLDVSDITNTMVSIDFLFIGKSSLRGLGQGFRRHFGRSLVSLGSLLVVCEGI